MPPRSRAFIIAVNASLCGLVGLLLGGYGIDLVRLQRPDFHYGTMLAAAIVGLGWCAGAALTWFVARPRPPPSRADVVLFLLGAVAVLWLGVQVARSVRYGNFGPMIDQEGSLDEPLLPVISMAYLVDAIVVAMTLVGLAALRWVAAVRRTASIRGQGSR
jgi:hypothetical protein